MKLPHLTSNIETYSAMLAVALISISMSTAVAQQRLEVQKTDYEGASVDLTGANLESIYRFQRSFDGANWDDLFVLTPDLNGVSFPDPLSDEEERAFYRIRSFDETERETISLNLDPTDKHLLSYRKGADLELHLFGARDETGNPSKVESYLFRVGNKTYSGTTPQPLITPLSNISEFSWTDEEFRHLTGYVFVERNDDCPVGSAPPVVEWRVTEMAPSFSDDPVFGQKQAVPAPEFGEVEGYDVFSYTIPWFSNGYQVPAPVDIEQFATDIFEQWLEDIIIGNQGMSLAGSALEVMALRGGASLNPLTGAASFLFGTIAPTFNARTAARNYDHGTETFGAFEASVMEVRARVPNGAANSEWHTISTPVLLTNAPDLTIDAAPCSGGTILIFADDSDIEAWARVYFGGSSRDEEISTKELGSSGNVSLGTSASAQWGNGERSGAASASLELYSGSNWIVTENFIHAEADGPHSSLQSSGETQASVFFMIVPDDPAASGGQVTCALSLDAITGSNRVEASVITTAGTPRALARLTTYGTSATATLSYNTRYRLYFFSNMNKSPGSSETFRARMIMEIQ